MVDLLNEKPMVEQSFACAFHPSQKETIERARAANAKSAPLSLFQGIG
ncbi:hypothetical protein [Noviherbaspirillum agri]